MRVTWGLGCWLWLLKTRFTQIHFTTIVTIRHEGCDVSSCFLIKSNDGKVFYIGKIGQTFVNIANCPHFTRHVFHCCGMPMDRVGLSDWRSKAELAEPAIPSGEAPSMPALSLSRPV